MHEEDIKDWPKWEDGNGRYPVYFTRYLGAYYCTTFINDYFGKWRLLKINPSMIVNKNIYLSHKYDGYISERNDFEDIKKYFEMDIMESIL